MTDEDRKRASRIATLIDRLTFLETLREAITQHSRVLKISLSERPGMTTADATPIYLRGVEAETAIGHFIAETTGELEPLL